MPPARPRPDFAAHQHATRATFNEIAAELRELLGTRLTAYIAGVAETSTVRQWADGNCVPSDLVQQRLRVVLQVALTLNEADGRELTQAWFQGRSPQLDDVSPARLLRDGELNEVGPAVIRAARASLAAG